MLKGIKVHPNNPFRFDFILDQGNTTNTVIASPKGAKQSQQEQLKQESTKLIKYFLASLTIPEKDLWVNLSPYEKNRIIPNSFGLTEMGRDLLAEDYMLKQITASLIYPEGETGKRFWKRIYVEAAEKFGTTNIPVNTFNKVWIVPEKAVVYENAKAGTAYVVDSKLKVMLEQDYLASLKPTSLRGTSEASDEAISKRTTSSDLNALGSQIIRQIVIPELTKEVNSGRNFAQLRQVYNSLILATWYKKKIKDSILSQVYENKNKVTGVEPLVSLRGRSPKQSLITDTEYIYQQYLQAFKKGAYNFIKEEIDPATEQPIPRKYFSGGEELINIETAMSYTRRVPSATVSNKVILSVKIENIDQAMNTPAPIIVRNMRRGIHMRPSVALYKIAEKYQERDITIHLIKDERPVPMNDTQAIFDSSIKNGDKIEIQITGADTQTQKEIYARIEEILTGQRGENAELASKIEKEGKASPTTDSAMNTKRALTQEEKEAFDSIFSKVKIESIEQDGDTLMVNLPNVLGVGDSPFLGIVSTEEGQFFGLIFRKKERSGPDQERVVELAASIELPVNSLKDEEFIVGHHLPSNVVEIIEEMRDSNGWLMNVYRNTVTPEQNKTALTSKGLMISPITPEMRSTKKLSIISNRDFEWENALLTSLIRAGYTNIVLHEQISELGPRDLDSDLCILHTDLPQENLIVEGHKLKSWHPIYINPIGLVWGADELIFSNHQEKKNSAMIAHPFGGIDLTKNVLQIQNVGDGIKFHIDPGQLAQLQNAPGFVPVIISIRPLNNLQQFLSSNA